MRLRGWEARLAAFVTDAGGKPFAYGEHDCILFGTAGAAAITGEDAAAAYRGQYSDRKGAAAILKRLGKGTLLRTIDASFARKPVAFAQRGDLVEFKRSIGICLGADAAFVSDAALLDVTGLRSLGHLVMVPRALWTRAWAV